MRKHLKLLSYLLMLSLLVSVFTIPVNAEGFEVDTKGVNLKTGLEQYEIAVDDAEDTNTEVYESGRKSSNPNASYWMNLSSDYYYNQLSGAEKGIWDSFEASCLDVLENVNTYEKMPKITNTAGVSLERLKEIAWMFKHSNPQYYFLSNRLWYSMSGSYFYFEVYDVFQNGADRQAYTALFKSQIDSWVAEVSKGARPENKEAIAHDLIANNTIYQANAYDQTAFSTFCLGKTVCAGYAGAMTILCNAVGIECITLTSDSHAWNNVNLHGNWYAVDVTWDDDDTDGVWYLLYNKSNETIRLFDDTTEHVVEAQWENGVPNCMFDSNVCVYTYEPGYAKDDNYVYFFVNDNTDRGPLLLKVIESLSGAPIEDAPKKVGSYNTTTASSVDVQPFVNRLYQILLNRSAELEGLSAWTKNLMSGESTSAEIVSGIIFSDEFKSRNLSYADAIECLYQAMLGRGSDEAGKNAWVANMNNGMTYTSIINGFAGSAEFSQICSEYGISAGNVEITEPRDMNSDVTGFIARCYREALQRNVDEDGLNAWCTVLLSGEESPKVVARGFVFSDEVIGQNLSNEDYVKLLYRLCMGREYDEAGFNAWCQVLAEGASREEVFWGFADSAEFAEIIADFGL